VGCRGVRNRGCVALQRSSQQACPLIGIAFALVIRFIEIGQRIERLGRADRCDLEDLSIRHQQHREAEEILDRYETDLHPARFMTIRSAVT
jgi:hypothetical protein